MILGCDVYPWLGAASSFSGLVFMISELTLNLQISPDIEDGLVRLDPSDMRSLGIIAGDIVALNGMRTSYARALPTSMEYRNQGLALVSPLFRSNLGIQSGQKVQVFPERKRIRAAETVFLQVDDDIDLLHLVTREKQLGSFWQERCVVAEDWLRVPTIDRVPLFAQIVKTQPDGPVLIGASTSYDFTALREDQKLMGLGGLRDVYRLCHKLAQARLRSGLRESAHAVLLHGPQGCGKARLVKRLGEEMGIPVVTLDAQYMFDKQLAGHAHDPGFSLTDLARRGPALLLLDHLHVLSSYERVPPLFAVASRLVSAQMCALLDEVRVHPNIMVFGIGSGAVDMRFKENGRFDVLLPVDVPNTLARQELFVLTTKKMPLADTVDYMMLAQMTSGAVGRDIFHMSMTASYLSQGAKVTEQDFADALRHSAFSETDEFRCDFPATSWADVAGLDDIKQLLRETLTWSLKHREKFSDAGVVPSRSILLSGGQGTGKTSLVRALANIIPVNILEVGCMSLAARDFVNAADTIKDVFSLARRKSPCLLFFDDIDVLFDWGGSQEDKEKMAPHIAQLLLELDALDSMPGVVVVAATNRPDRLSEDIMRPGRFDFALTLPMPDYAARKKILHIHARKLPLSSDVDFDRLADLTQGMSPSEIAALCNRVGLMALRQSMSSDHGGGLLVVSAALFEQAMRGRKV